MAKIVVDKMLTELEKQYTSWFDRLNVELRKEAVEKSAKSALRYLKANSPKGNRKTKNYAKTWKADRNQNTGIWRYAMTIYNDKNYRLTHLLEHGHAVVGGGRTQAQPHIADAEKIAEDELFDAVIDIVSRSV